MISIDRTRTSFLLILCIAMIACGFLTCSDDEESVTSLNYALPTPVINEFCVQTADEFQHALDIAATNDQSDVIKLVQGTYYGNFDYEARDEQFDLSIEGGYEKDCITQFIDPANTIIDAQNDRIPLGLESLEAVKLNVMGITFQNGNNKVGFGGGLWVSGGEITISQCNFNHNSTTCSGGGVFAGGTNHIITIIDNKFTFNNASYGGGIDIFQTDYLERITIARNEFFNNRAGGGGSDLSIWRVHSPCLIVINENKFINNQDSYYHTGGIYIKENNIDGQIVFESNVVMGHSGVKLSRFSEITVRNNLFVNNKSDLGGGLSCTCGEVFRLINNTFFVNSATDCGGAVWLKFKVTGAIADIYNNILWMNQAGQTGHDFYIENDQNGNSLGVQLTVRYNDLNLGYDGVFISIPQSIDSSNRDRIDPYFVDPSNDVNPDYHLQSWVGSYHGGEWLPDALHSTCIDAGAPDPPYNDYSYEPNPNGSRVNMGCYGNTGEASKSN